MSLDAAIASAVEGAVERVLARWPDPVEPITYSVPGAALAIGTSQDTVRRLIRTGVLPTVPHMGERLLIPRSAVVRLVESGS